MRTGNMEDWRTGGEIAHLQEQNRRLEDGQTKLNRVIDELWDLQHRLSEFLDAHPIDNKPASIVQFPHDRARRHKKDVCEKWRNDLRWASRRNKTRSSAKELEHR